MACNAAWPNVDMTRTSAGRDQTQAASQRKDHGDHDQNVKRWQEDRVEIRQEQALNHKDDDGNREGDGQSVVGGQVGDRGNFVRVLTSLVMKVRKSLLIGPRVNQ